MGVQLGLVASWVGPAWGVVLLCVAVLVGVLGRSGRIARQTARAVALAAIAGAVACVTLGWLAAEQLIIALAGLPPLVAAVHVAQLGTLSQRPEGVPDLVQHGLPERYARGVARHYQSQVQDEVERSGVGFLTLRFGVPIGLLFLTAAQVGLWLRELSLCDSLLGPELPKAMLASMQWGFAGAYAYVLITVGRRAVARDITPAMLLWSVTSLVAGPLIGGILGAFDKVPGLEAAVPSYVSFLAGFLTRATVQTLEGGARRVLGGAPAAPVPDGMSLFRVRGMTQEIVDRLAEESVADVSALALVTPRRLRRNTAFDRRQIAGWIDEALLIYTLPEHARRLQEVGVTGALDLTWYVVTTDTPSSGMGRPPLPATFATLATRVGADPELLWDAANRLALDEQVLAVRALYAGTEAGATKPPP